MFVIESVVFTFYFSNFARVIASWMLSSQIEQARSSTSLGIPKTFNIKNDVSRDVVSQVTSVNRMIRYFLLAYYITGIPMVI